MTEAVSEAPSNGCAQCNGASQGSFCRCDETRESLNSSRDPIWIGDFPGTNQSGVQGRTYRTAEFWEILKGRTAAVFRPVTSFVCMRNSSERMKNRSFMCGSLLLIFGAYLLVFPEDGLGLQTWSILIIGVGGLCIWIPVIYWTNETERGNSSQQEAHHVSMDEPPRYDTLVALPKDPPPAYDQVFPESAEGAVVIPHECYSTAIQVPICSVHQPITIRPIISELPNHQTTDSIHTLYRSRSLGDLSR